MKNRELAFVYTPEVEALSYPDDCPFKTCRTGLTRQRLRSFGLLGVDGYREVAPRQATRDELEHFHTLHYLAELQRAATGDLTLAGLKAGLGGPDTPVFRDLHEYGAWACGAALTGADLLLAGKADIVFSLLGGFHHAFPERAAGFCYLNDVVLAAMRMAEANRRVAYLDLDAHHGDGVQYTFYGRDDVLTISLHESGQTLFPWGGFENEIGVGRGRGYNVNVSLPAGTYDEAYLEAYEEVAAPLLNTFDPDYLLVELGLDTLAGDPLTHMRLTNNAVVEVLEQLLRLQKPMLVLGGGGYHVENTVRGWALAWRTCCGVRAEEDWAAGLGGVMLANAEWAGGLRDRALAVTPEQREAVEPALRTAIDDAIRHTFRYHGLPVPSVRRCGVSVEV